MRITSFLRTTLLLLSALFFTISIKASNATEARSMFYHTWGMVTSQEGFSLNYSVNIMSLYKSSGRIWIKGKKKYYVEQRYISWCDGKTLYRVDLKKKEVELHNPASPKRDKYTSKFSFAPENYDYSWKNSKQGIVITLTAKKGADTGVKHAKVVLDRRTHYPIELKVKVAFLWANVHISNFHPGDINDSIFKYPANRFKGYKFTNCWPD